MKISFDYRYENTLRINFPVDIEEDSEIYNKINETIIEFFDDDIELDWRDDREIEIHNVKDNQKHIGIEEKLIYKLSEIIE